MLLIAFFCFVVLLVVFSAPYLKKRHQKIVDKLFSGRQPLTPTDFYAQYFENQGVPFDVVMGVRQVLQEQLNADLSRLNAEDDFSKNLSYFFENDSMADVEIIVGLEKKFGIKIQNHEAENTHTIRQLVQLVARKVA